MEPEISADAPMQHSSAESQPVQHASTKKYQAALEIEEEITASAEIEKGTQQPSSSCTHNECTVHSTQTLTQRIGAGLRSLSEVSPSGIRQFVRNVSPRECVVAVRI
jgi:hypothetical protein